MGERLCVSFAVAFGVFPQALAEQVLANQLGEMRAFFPPPPSRSLPQPSHTKATSHFLRPSLSSALLQLNLRRDSLEGMARWECPGREGSFEGWPRSLIALQAQYLCTKGQLGS